LAAQAVTLPAWVGACGKGQIFVILVRTSHNLSSAAQGGNLAAVSPVWGMKFSSAGSIIMS
jgi:hypothetical protein